MRANVKSFVKVYSKIFNPSEPIIEIGSMQVSGQEDFADLRPYFRGKIYVGCDIRPGLGVDKIENIEHLAMKNGSIDTILMIDALEHIENPHKALDEINRVLKPNGAVVITSVMNFPIHEYPSDFWRFTPEAFKLLLKKFPAKIIGSQGYSLNPHTIFGIGFKSSKPVDKFEEFYHTLSEELNKEALPLKTKLLTHLLKLMSVFTPPITNKYYASLIFSHRDLSLDCIEGGQTTQKFRNSKS